MTSIGELKRLEATGRTPEIRAGYRRQIDALEKAAAPAAAAPVAKAKEPFEDAIHEDLTEFLGQVNNFTDWLSVGDTASFTSDEMSLLKRVRDALGRAHEEAAHQTSD